LKITSEDLENRQIQLVIELEPEEIEKHKERSYKKLVGRYDVPGFRKGKTPRSILERFIGSETLVQEGLEQFLDDMTVDAVQEEKLEPVAPPKITDIDSLDPITFTAMIPLKPEVNLGDYDSIRLPKEKVKVDESQVEEVIENIVMQRTPWEPVDRGLQLGDLSTVDIDGYVIKDDGKVSDSAFMAEKSISYLINNEVTYPVPGFADNLVGASQGDTREFSIEVPDDFSMEELKGKEAKFVVTVHEVKDQVKPEINDEWAKSVELSENESYDSLDDLKNKIRGDIEERAKQDSDAQYEEQILTLLEEKATLNFPPLMLDAEIDHMIQDQDQQLRGMGMSLETYLESSGQDPDSIRESMKPQAEKRIKQSLLVSELAEVAKITPSDEEIQEEIDRFIEEQPEGPQREQAVALFTNPAARDTINRRLTARQTVDFLSDIATQPVKKKRKSPSKKKTTKASKSAGTKTKARKKSTKKVSD